MNIYLFYLPDEWFQLRDFGGQADTQGESVRQAGDGAGNNGPSHGEGQHGVDNKHDEQKEGHLETGRCEKVIKQICLKQIKALDVLKHVLITSSL